MVAANHPDNANPPAINKPETILGLVITSILLAAIAISLRIYVRARARLLGWDDLVVFLAAASTIAGSSLVCFMPEDGMGKHWWTLSKQNMVDYYKHVWATNVTYTASAALIKLAILLQYLRLFDMQRKVARVLTWFMIVFTSMWGLAFFLLALFSCTPIEKNWNFTLKGKCVAWGSKDANVFFASWAAHASSNILFDILVLVLPIPFLKGLRMHGKSKMGLIALFTMGGVVVSLSIARMVALAIKRAGTVPVFDPSWHTPSVYIFSVLEINFAILCASIPIFWPLVSSLAFNKILVVNEIEVRTDRRGSTPFGIGLAEQGASVGVGAVGIPELEMEMGKRGSGRTSRMSVVEYASSKEAKDSKFARATSKITRSKSPSRHTHHTRSQPSTSSSNKSLSLGPILGRHPSQESQQNLAHHSSNGTLSSNSPDPPHLDAVSRNHSNNSASNYDRYVQDWAVPDFDKPGAGVPGGASMFSTTVERAEIPFDHIKALEERR